MAERPSKALRGASIALVAAAIGSIGSLVGVFVANSNARDNLAAQLEHEDDMRLFDLKREAYQEFFVTAVNFLFDTEAFLLGEEGALDKQTARHKFRKLVAAASGIYLIGTADAALNAQSVVGDFSLMVGQQGVDLSRDNVARVWEDADHDIEVFMNDANNELSPEPLGRSEVR